MKDDAPANNLANNIELDIKAMIPHDMHVFLVIGTPVKQIRKTQAKVAAAITHMIQNNIFELDRKFLDNDISISIFTGWGSYTPKIGYAISNRYSSANIGKNTENMLRERIQTKNKKRNVKPDTDEYWLALFNDYWVADEESYQLAYRNLDIEHNFDKIIIINGHRQANVLHKT